MELLGAQWCMDGECIICCRLLASAVLMASVAAGLPTSCVCARLVIGVGGSHKLAERVDVVSKPAAAEISSRDNDLTSSPLAARLLGFEMQSLGLRPLAPSPVARQSGGRASSSGTVRQNDYGRVYMTAVYAISGTA